jgi:hypothetical protein
MTRLDDLTPADWALIAAAVFPPPGAASDVLPTRQTVRVDPVRTGILRTLQHFALFLARCRDRCSP